VAKPLAKTRIENDSLGAVDVPADKLWGAQTERALRYFAIGRERMPREMIAAYAIVKRAAAVANAEVGALETNLRDLIVRACDEILAGRFDDMFPLPVWISGSGTQFNMNVNEVIGNRVSQLAGTALGSKAPAHPNDHVNLSQSTNDTFPTAMNIAVALAARDRLSPALSALESAIGAKAEAWADVVKPGRTHMQDATPLTLGQEWSGYAAMIEDGRRRVEAAMSGIFRLPLGGTAVGTGLNAPAGFAEQAVREVARLTALPFVCAPNYFAVQGAHDDLLHVSAALRTLAASLYKIANDVRLMASGPSAGLGELRLPANEPGSSMMPGKVNPTQAEALAMIAAQVMGNDVAVGFAGAGGLFEMNVYKPLIIANVMQSLSLLSDGCTSFRLFLVEGAEPNRDRIAQSLRRLPSLATALVPLLGYDAAARVAHEAAAGGLTVREAALRLGLASEAALDDALDATKMTKPGL